MFEKQTVIDRIEVLADQMYVGIAISVVVTLLRIVTTQPISEK